MKLTTERLKRLIQEEISKLMEADKFSKDPNIDLDEVFQKFVNLNNKGEGHGPGSVANEYKWWAKTFLGSSDLTDGKDLHDETWQFAIKSGNKDLWLRSLEKDKQYKQDQRNIDYKLNQR